MTTEYMIVSALLNARTIDACTAYVFYKHAKGRRRMHLNEHFSFSCRSNVRYATKVDSTRASQKSAGYVLQLDRSRKRGDRNHQARRARFPEHRSLASPWTRWRCGIALR